MSRTLHGSIRRLAARSVARHRRLSSELSFFDEVKELNRHKGKPFAADTALRPIVAPPADDASRAPPEHAAVALHDVACVDLDDSPTNLLSRLGGAPATLLTLSFRAVGARHAPSWAEPFSARVGAGRARDGARGVVGAASLAVVEPGALGLLGPVRRAVLSGLRRDTALGLHPRTLVTFEDPAPLRRALRLENRLVGYAFLVDAAGYVRWRGCGEATPDEVEALLACTMELCAQEPDAKDAPRGRGARRSGRNA